MDLARQAATKDLNLSIHRRGAETRRKAKREVGVRTGGGRLADRFAGRPEYARAKGAEGAEDAEEMSVSRNRRGARRFCTLAVQIRPNAIVFFCFYLRPSASIPANEVASLRA